MRRWPGGGGAVGRLYPNGRLPSSRRQSRHDRKLLASADRRPSAFDERHGIRCRLADRSLRSTRLLPVLTGSWTALPQFAGWAMFLEDVDIVPGLLVKHIEQGLVDLNTAFLGASGGGSGAGAPGEEPLRPCRLLFGRDVQTLDERLPRVATDVSTKCGWWPAVRMKANLLGRPQPCRPQSPLRGGDDRRITLLPRQHRCLHPMAEGNTLHLDLFCDRGLVDDLVVLVDDGAHTHTPPVDLLRLRTTACSSTTVIISPVVVEPVGWLLHTHPVHDRYCGIAGCFKA